MKPVTMLIILFPSLVLAQNNELQQNKEETFTNPVWDGADPWMVKEGELLLLLTRQTTPFRFPNQKMTQKRAKPAQSGKRPKPDGTNLACGRPKFILSTDAGMFIMLPENQALRLSTSEPEFCAQKPMMFSVNTKIWEFCTPAMILRFRNPTSGPST
jgi:hypothetical protein